MRDSTTKKMQEIYKENITKTFQANANIFLLCHSTI